jgi:hypothetical protein
VQAKAIYILLAVYAIAGIVTIIIFNGTGDNGDSIMHYLFARYAPVHPELYFDHWAKPLFVLISSPFAQFGFIGMKLFNLCVNLLTFHLTYLTARSLSLPNPLLSVVFLLFMPLYYILTFSGLTEPLFAFFLIGAVYLAVQRKFLLAAIVVSFMPFVRSEGLIIMIVFGCWLLVKKQWKYLPLLLTGHLVYSVAGYFVYHDLLWVFTKIPYSSLEPKYGSGPLLHFIFQLNYVIGIPLYFLLVAGILSYPWHWFRSYQNQDRFQPGSSYQDRLNLQPVNQKSVVIYSDETILILAGFFLFLIAHSLFWYLGIFNSMGLKRVLIGVAPLMSLIALRGYNLITAELFTKYKLAGQITGGMLLAYLLIFPFTHNPAAINWNQDMKLTREQALAKAVASYVKANPVQLQNKLLYTHPYLSEVMNIDHFDERRRQDLTFQNIDQMQSGDKLIWENWFAVVESKTTLERILNSPGLVREINFSSKSEGREVKFVVFRKE